MKKRILIFSIAYDPLVGGAELAVRNITDRLFDYEFDMITCRFDRAHKIEQRIGNVNVYRVGFGSRIGRMLYPVFAFRLAKKLHAKQSYEIIWAIMAAYAGAAGLMFKRHFPTIKFFLTLQEGDPISHIHKRVRGFTKKWKAIFRNADYIQVISNFLADWAKKEGAVCSIEVVPNGVDIKKFKMKGERLKVVNSKFTIITTSRLVQKNGIDILIRAGAKLKLLIPGSRFSIQIAGIGSEESNLKKLAKELQIADRVEFLGNISQDDVPKYLSQADIFVRPSRSEGLGTAFLEAMAAGLPVIGTPVGGIPDFLRDRQTGLFCRSNDPGDLAEKIKLLLDNSELRIKLGENGRKLAEEKYNWDIVAQKMNLIFHQI